jgi:hypothetical protein
MVKLSAASPVGTSSTTTLAYVGMSPTSASSVPKAKAAPSRKRVVGRVVRRVEASAPASEPTAIAVDSSPYAAAPRPKTSRASRAMVTGKLSPKVPTTKTIAIGSSRSGRDRT